MWVSKSHAKLAAALRAMGHKIADSSIPKLLGLLKYRRPGVSISLADANETLGDR